MQILKEEVRTAIIQAAITEFREHGYADASMRRMAKAAGITTGNIYRYFKGKAELFDCIVGPAYAKYSSYAEEYLQTADFALGGDETSKHAFFETVQTSLFGLIRDGSTFMLLLCRSGGSKYEGIKRELVQFTDSLLLKLMAWAKTPARPLSDDEREEAHMLAYTIIESLIFIMGSYEDEALAGKLTDRLVDVYSSGIDRLLQELKEER